MKRRVAFHALIDAAFGDVAYVFENRARDTDLLPDMLRVKLTDDTTVGRHIAVSFTGTSRNADGVMCELHVRAGQHRHMFPTFDGTLLLRAGADNDTAAWLIGDYEHPLGPIGAAGGAIGGERLARESLRAMFDTLVDELANEARHYRAHWQPADAPPPLIHRRALG